MIFEESRLRSRMEGGGDDGMTTKETQIKLRRREYKKGEQKMKVFQVSISAVFKGRKNG